MSSPVRYIFRLVLFILVQQFVLYQVPPLHQYLSPVIYYLFILWLPFTTGRSSLLLISFITGITLDFFTKTPGMHAAACVFIGYIRPFLINILLPQQGVDFNYREPSATSLGLVPYATYVALLTLLHHGVLFSVQAFQFGNVLYLVLKTAGSFFISLLLIFIIEIIFTRKQKFITNT